MPRQRWDIKSHVSLTSDVEGTPDEHIIRRESLPHSGYGFSGNFNFSCVLYRFSCYFIFWCDLRTPCIRHFKLCSWRGKHRAVQKDLSSLIFLSLASNLHLGLEFWRRINLFRIYLLLPLPGKPRISESSSPTEAAMEQFCRRPTISVTLTRGSKILRRIVVTCSAHMILDKTLWI